MDPSKGEGGDAYLAVCVHNEADITRFPPPAFLVNVGWPYAARMPGGLAPMPFGGRPAPARVREELWRLDRRTVNESYDHAVAVAALLARERERERARRLRPGHRSRL